MNISKFILQGINFNNISTRIAIFEIILFLIAIVVPAI